MIQPVRTRPERQKAIPKSGMKNLTRYWYFTPLEECLMDSGRVILVDEVKRSSPRHMADDLRTLEHSTRSPR